MSEAKLDQPEDAQDRLGRLLGAMGILGDRFAELLPASDAGEADGKEEESDAYFLQVIRQLS